MTPEERDECLKTITEAAENFNLVVTMMAYSLFLAGLMGIVGIIWKLCKWIF